MFTFTMTVMLVTLRQVVVLCVVSVVVNGHDWGWGKCPRVDHSPNLSSDQVSISCYSYSILHRDIINPCV
ncbi:putative SP-like 4 [Homarus americanus]|uniref:Putative SP-like 4 n=1 Tax=Homarus americanus TaxID=6706 RepID=A0A8J5N634_HOMAM|nr:putative SP-like 4 [Homarus americanus]